MNEKVLVIERRLIHTFIYGKRCHLIKNCTKEIISKIYGNYTFMDRNMAEKAYSYKQIIPYILIRHNNNYLLLRRTKMQNEVRLHDKLSLGIGGHINILSKNAPDLLMHGLKRELNEEIKVNSPYQINFIGIINDETSDVGKVHLGLLYIIDTPDDFFEIIEKDKMVGKWSSKAELGQSYDKLENWSKISYDFFIKYRG